VKTDMQFRYLTQFLLEWEMFHIKSVEKIETHISCSVDLSRKLCRLRDSVEKCFESGRPQTTIWRMRMACWIPKSPNTHSECVIPTAFHCNNGFPNTPLCRTLPVLFWVSSHVFIVLGSLTVVLYFGQPYFLCIFLGNLSVVQFIFTFPAMKKCCVD